MTPHEEERVPCDFCGAQSNERCRDTRTGAFTRAPHPSRRRKLADEIGDHDWESWNDHWSAFHE